MEQLQKSPTQKISKILLFGGKGKLGTEIAAQVASDIELLTPSTSECNITKTKDVDKTVKKINPDAVINAAAIVGVNECESNKLRAWNTNVIGATNVAKSCLKKNIRLVYISSSGIFDGKTGNYSEIDPPSPISYYAITKVVAEQVASVVPNNAVIRLDFFPLNKFKYDQVFTDHYTSKIPVTEAASKVLQVVNSNFIGIINVGQERKSLYNLLKPYFPEITPIKVEESALPNFPKDISLDLSKWRRIFE